MQHGHKNYGVNCAQKVLDGRELTDFYDISTGERLKRVEDGKDETVAINPLWWMFGIILLFLCYRSSVSPRWAGFAVQPNGVTGFAIYTLGLGGAINCDNSRIRPGRCSYPMADKYPSISPSRPRGCSTPCLWSGFAIQPN